ncbi:carbohydrate ABC transporter permease [Vallitalea pronyensis]|uniref:Carbohydrate ABC transporter permease n=1 Tax=Vallitalea pronyensis TaxID=1348613 RepID=A0A8J8MM19_9FIRM|nr:carbohydrate ABC transporter permease [Vallitalea pronyensis]QUI24165.1 carbohydrate ABC transporter permease [Vallitalea pronyensis]
MKAYGQWSYKCYIFSVFNYTLLALMGILMIIPFWYVIVMSFNEGTDTALGGILYFPRSFTLDNFKAVFADKRVISSFGISVSRLLIGTPLHLLVIGMAGWAVSRKKLPFRKVIVGMILISMFVNAGLIPFYLTLSAYGLINHYLVYILPTLFSGWELMILVTAIRAIPESLIESARLDGASDYRIFFQIIAPLTKATFATIGLFNAVWAWGDWYTGTFLISSNKLWSIATYLQMVLQRGLSIQIRSAADAANAVNALKGGQSTLTESSLRAATLVVTVVPIMCVYPFLQKYFIHGIMLGSIKE